MSSERAAEPGRLSWSARIVFTVVAVAAFILGVVGFHQYLPDHPEYGRDLFDLVYYSLQLFVLDAAPLQTATDLPEAALSAELGEVTVDDGTATVGWTASWDLAAATEFFVDLPRRLLK